SRVDEPVIVCVLVVIASNLLLSGTLWVSLDVGMEQATSVAHILQGYAGSNGYFQRAVPKVGSLEICLEKRAHLGISGTTVGKNRKVQPEASHIHRKWKTNQASNAGSQVSTKGCRWHLEIA